MPSRRRPSRLTGPTTRGMAHAAGLDDKQLRTSDVVRLSRDTYLPRAIAGDLRARVAAVLLTAPPGAAVSHLTAAALWQLAVPLRPTEEPVHITVGTGSAVRGRQDRVVHRSVLADDDVTRSGGIPMTLLASGSTILELQTQLLRRPNGRGSARARAVLPVADPRAESPMESMLRWLLHAAGVPRPVLQYEVRDAGGRFLGRADLAWPDSRLLVEFDGDVHRDRRVFVDDLRRQNLLVAEGWTVLRFTSADLLGRPDDVVAQIRRALAR